MGQSSHRVIAAAYDPFSRNTTVECFGSYLRKQDCCMMAITVDSYGCISSSICFSTASYLVEGFDYHQYDGASIVGGTAFAIKSVVMAASDTH